jgi:dihydrolipoamide dehydrogenase
MYDLGIIGGGPAGYVAGERAGQNGLKTVLFEGKSLGGVCLNEGCIPSKTLLFTAKLYEYAKEGAKYGINTENVTYDFDKIMKRKNKVVKKLVGGVGAKMKHQDVEVVKEFAHIEGKNNNTIQIKAGDKTYECKNILIATGSEAAIPPIKGLERDKVLTNREILDIDHVPESLTVIGGGVIGMEFACFFSTMGTKVTVIEMLPEILNGIDTELAGSLRDEYSKKGIEFHLNARVNEVKGKEVLFEKAGKQQSVTSDEILVSAGRRPVIKGYGLEKLGVETDRNAVKIDKQCRTNIPGVYAAGDITGFSLLAHTAYREAEVAVNTILGKKDIMRYNAIPGVVYTSPEISCVGLTEDEAKKKNVKYKVRKLPMQYAGRFIAENEGKNGYCKVLVGEKYEEILGVHMIGNPSSEMIYGAAMAIEMQLRLKEMQEIVFPHPTVSEIFRETVFSFGDK